MFSSTSSVNPSTRGIVVLGVAPGCKFLGGDIDVFVCTMTGFAACPKEVEVSLEHQRLDLHSGNLRW